ncbi:MAG: hypothetical protein HOP06_08930 [Methylotenera sp.]|nr:hypothetical protein [Methylotenera sp.]
MAYLSAVKIGNKHGLSYQKINKILTVEGYINEATKRPSAASFESGLASLRTSKSQFTSDQIEFVVWDYTKLKSLFPEPVKKIKSTKPRTYPYYISDPLEPICAVFTTFYVMLDLDNQSHIKGVSSHVLQAATECYFDDPHFLGGTKFMHRQMTKADAVQIEAIVVPMAAELFEAAKKISLKEAKANMLELDVALLNLHKNAL